MKTVKVREVEIGKGTPKIIVPIVGETHEEILGKAESLLDMKIDAVEWRADFYDSVFDREQLIRTLSALRIVLEETPLLFTLRTKNEGGKREISPKEYFELNEAVAKSGKADLVDVEIFFGDDVARRTIEAVHEVGVLVVGSNHDFFDTPDVSDMISRLRKIQAMGADIAKLAVMPNSNQDVLALLAATAEMNEKYAEIPIVTVSMSARGVISRLSGEQFGSAMTFGAAIPPSAPGQIPVEQLSQILGILHSVI